MIYRNLVEIADELFGPPRTQPVWVGEVDGFGRVRRVLPTVGQSIDVTPPSLTFEVQRTPSQ